MVRSVLCLTVLTLLAGTAVAFQPSGVYRGGWRSNTTGHRGPMRVRITPRSDGTYNARFVGRFALVIPFAMNTTMTPVAVGHQQTVLVANKRLPIFGDYRMTATVSPCRVDAQYSADGDRGTFTMTRRR